MAYSTFTNEIDTNVIDTNEIDTNKIDTNKKDKLIILVDVDVDKQCIICLEKTPINDKDHITLMNEMHFLVKKCNCLCYAHHKCLEKWIGTNAVCPICKGEISFPVMVMKNKECIIELPTNYIVQSNTSSTTGSSHCCIRMTILVFFVLTVLQILFRN